MSLNTILATAPLATTGFHIKATGTTLGNSLIWDNGTNVGIGNTNTSYTLDVSGTLRNTTSAYFATTSGSVGIGTTSPSGKLHIYGKTYARYGSDDMFAFYYDDTYRFGLTNPSTDLRQLRVFGQAADGNSFIVLATGNDTERMRITSTGNVGIGTSSPSEKLHIYGTGANTQALLLESSISIGNAYATFKNTSKFYITGLSADFSNSYIIYDATASAARMVITSGGDVLVNKTSATNTGKFELNYSRNDNVGMNLNDTTATAGCGHIYFQRGGTNVGSITSPNNSSTAFNTSSDYRLKEDLQEINGLEKTLAIKVYNFKWKNEEDRSDGVLAHELAEILPYAVNGEKDAIDEKDNIIPQGVDYSKLIPVLVKAIQEQQIQIQNLQEQINILAK